MLKEESSTRPEGRLPGIGVLRAAWASFFVPSGGDMGES